LTSNADELTIKAFALAYAGKYAEAILVAHQVLAMREQLLGPDHPDVATVLNSFGSLYEQVGRYADAEQFYKRMLAIREKALSPDHPDYFLVAQSLNNLARSTIAKAITLKPSRSTSDHWRYSRKPLAPTIPTSLSR
jgi:tetratricopeptide (TPR) repeat protein